MSEHNREQQQQKQGPLGPQQSEKSTQDLQQDQSGSQRPGQTPQEQGDDTKQPDADGLSERHVQQIRDKGF